jgi:hypothetical protein
MLAIDCPGGHRLEAPDRAHPHYEREALTRSWVGYFERRRSEAGVCAPRPYLIIQGRRVD